MCGTQSFFPSQCEWPQGSKIGESLPQQGIHNPFCLLTWQTVDFRPSGKIVHGRRISVLTLSMGHPIGNCWNGAHDLSRKPGRGCFPFTVVDWWGQFQLHGQHYFQHWPSNRKCQPAPLSISLSDGAETFQRPKGSVHSSDEGCFGPGHRGKEDLAVATTQVQRGEPGGPQQYVKGLINVQKE